MILSESTFNDIGEYLKINKSILIPVGSIEQHSEALPLATDTLIAEDITKKIAKRKKWLVGPTLNIGYSDIPQPFMKFAGTISYKPKTLILVITDYILSLYQHGFRNFYIINAHGGNSKFIKIVVKNLEKKLFKCKIFLYNWWEIKEIKQFYSGVDRNALNHAGTAETALSLYLFNSLVHRSFFAKEYIGINTKTGIINSDQTVATELLGKRIFELIIKNIIDEISLSKK